jgi:hypothetical protein
MNAKKLSPALCCFFLALPVLICPDIAPAKTVTVKGYVKDAQGNPLEAVKVSVAYKRFQKHGGWVISRHTDEDGHWTCRLEEYVGLLDIQYVHPDFVPLIERPNNGLKTKDGAFQVTLQQGLSLEALILDADGHPVISGEVTINRSLSYPIQEGVCSIKGLPAGETALRIFAKDHGPRVVSVNVYKGMKPVQISLDQGQSFSGIVVDVNDRPISHVNVYISDHWETDEGYFDLPIKRGTTDANGVFHFGQLPLQGQQKINLKKENFVTIYTHMPTDLSKTMKYVLAKPPVFEGKVIDSNSGEPIQSFNLLTGRKWSPNQTDFEYDHERYLEEIESPDGTFSYCARYWSIPYPCKYVYTVRVEAHGYLPKDVRAAKLDEKVSGLVIALERGSAVHGVVTDTEGRPASGAQVALVPPSMDVAVKNKLFHQPIPGQYLRQTDESGQFRFIPTQDQDRSLLVVLHADGYALIWCSNYRAGSEIRLIPWARVSGRLETGPFSRQGRIVTLGKSQCLQRYTDPRVNWYFEPALVSEDRFTYDCVPAIPLCVYLRDQDQQYYEATPLFPQAGENCQVEITPKQSNGATSAEFPPDLLAGRALPWHPNKRFAVDPEDQTVYYESKDWQMQVFPGQALPDLSDLALQPQIDLAKERSLLICFIDLGQRPSRHSAKVLAQHEKRLKAKGIQVILIDSAEGTQESRTDWSRQNSISYPVRLMHGGLSPKTRFEWRIRSLPWMILPDEKRVIQTHGLSLSELIDRLNI